MRLIIAEKPSLGRAIAAALPKPHKNNEGHIIAGNGDVVTWCIGHLLEQAEPDAYDPHYKKWQLDHLPIIPGKWQLKPKPSTRKQLNVVKKLLPNAKQLVHAGDPDREGQLLVDEVISFLGAKPAIKSATQRLLIHDLNTAAISKALDQMRSNAEFIPLSVSALARSRADWLYGINMTRLCTLHGQSSGYRGVLSVGRVQTPVLGLVVRRDREIEQFTPHDFYEVWADLKHPNGSCFEAKWLPSEACERFCDDEGRMLSKPLCLNVIDRITDKPAKVVDSKRQTKKQSPPLPYNLSALQIDANKRFHFSAKQVLDTCQSLYERHKLITYPRSDCRYLPAAHFHEAQAVRGAIQTHAPELASAVQQADLSLRSKAWNDSKVSAHHAIIPTAKMSAGALSDAEAKVYALIARQYIMQFYPQWQYLDAELLIEIEGGLFQAKSRETLHEGWRALLPKAKDSSSEQAVSLPDLKKGDLLHCAGGRLQEKETQPPKYFTAATLLAAMTGIARFVRDPEIKKVLKETDGLGTEATRAQIIELLFDRQFMEHHGKQIRSTETGRALIDSLPQDATSPDLTAHWESQLAAMADKQVPYDAFMADMQSQLGRVMHAVNPGAFSPLNGKGSGKSFKRKSKSAGKTTSAKRKSTNSRRKSKTSTP